MDLKQHKTEVLATALVAKPRMSGRPAHAIMDGARVILHGLKAKPELNGVAGIITGERIASSGRYPVKLSTGGALSVKRENLLGADTRCGFDFDAIIAYARDPLELVQDGEVDDMTDQIAKGQTTEEQLLDDWIPRVLAAARLQRPKLECDVGMLRPGSSMIRQVTAADAEEEREQYGEDELLCIGREADFQFHFIADIHIDESQGVPLMQEANDRIAAGIKRTLAAQGVWGDAAAGPIAAAAKSLQPVAVAMLMRSPEWLSKDEVLLAASCGFVIPAKPMIEFRRLGSKRLLHLLPLIKAALEPSGKPAESYAVALEWLRPRLAKDFGTLLMLEAMHAAVLKGESLERAVGRHKWIIANSQDNTNAPPTLRTRESATHEGVQGSWMSLEFSEVPTNAKDKSKEPASMNLDLFLSNAVLDAARADGSIWAGDGSPVRIPWPEVKSLAEDENVGLFAYASGGAAEELPLADVPQMEAFAVGHVRAGSLLLSGRPPPPEVQAKFDVSDPSPPHVSDVLSRQHKGRASRSKSGDQSDVMSLGMAQYRHVDGGTSTARVAAPESTDQVGGMISLGIKEDWAWLNELEQHVFPAGTPLHGIGGALNRQMSNAIKRALAKQAAWASAPKLVKEAQAMLVALFLDKPRWLSADDIHTAIKLGLATEKPDGSLKFNSLLGKSELFPLIKAALEPSVDPTANHRVGVRWVRSQHADPERPIPKLTSVMRLEALNDSVERGSTLEAAAVQIEMIRKGQTVFKVLSKDATRDGQDGLSFELHFKDRDDLRVPEIFVPGEVFEMHYESGIGDMERDMSEESLAARGFHMAEVERAVRLE